MQVTTEIFTPERAAQVLKAQSPDENRNINSAHVSKLAADMRSGRWKVNGETIKFNCSERLLDGQHRLHACVLAGVSFQTLVVRDIPTEVFSTIDTGRRRLLADVLKLSGLVPVSHALVASAVNTLWLYEHGTYGRSKNNKMPSHEEALQLFEREPGLLECVRPAQRVAQAGLIAPGPFAAFFLMFKKKDSTLAEIFLEGLVNGAGLAEGEPVLALRNRLAQERSTRRRLPKHYELAFVVKAWNATRKNQRMKLVKWSEDEGFPEVV